jgi:hypothetical protein
MFSVGEKYSINGLCELSTEKYIRRLNDCSALEFLHSVPNVYNMTPASIRPLRDAAKKYAKRILEYYIKEKYTEIQEVYESVTPTVPDFLKDYLDAYIESSNEKWTCRYCYEDGIKIPIKRWCHNCGGVYSFYN